MSTAPAPIPVATSSSPSDVYCDEHEARLWHRYLETRSDQDRNAVVEEYIDLVHYQISKARLPVHITADDLSGGLMVDLVQAVERFDPEKGYRPRTFLTYRLRGAIQDFLRNWSRPDGWHRTLGQIAQVRSIDARETQEGNGDCDRLHGRRQALFVDEDGEEELGFVDDADTVEQVAKLLEAAGSGTSAYVAELQAQVLRLRYLNGLSFDEIGKRLGHSLARASQLHQRAINRLRKDLAPQLNWLLGRGQKSRWIGPVSPDRPNRQPQPVAQFDDEGNFLNSYPSLSAAARAMDVSAGALWSAFHHGRRCGGFQWQRVDQE